MLFVEGDVRFLVARGKYGLWLVYDSYISASTDEISYYGKNIVRSNIDKEEEAIETARNYEREYQRIRSDENKKPLESLYFYLDL